MKRTALKRRTQIRAKTPLSAKRPVQKACRKPKRAVQKESRFRSERYLAFVRSLPCCLCNQFGCDAHHAIGLGWGLSGMGLTAPDSFAVPACRRCHQKIHNEPDLQRLQPWWLVDTINRGLDVFTDEPIVGALCEALEFIAEREAE